MPLGNDVPWYDFTIGLSGVQYQLTIRFNSRMERWLMDIASAGGTPLLSSVPLLIGRNLIGRFAANAALPVGMFFVLDNTNSGAEPTRNSFGTTHTLWYQDPTGTT